MKDLIRKNILRSKPYIPGKPIEEVERELGITDIIKLASNENPLGPSSLAQEAILKYLKKISLYPDSDCFSLKQKLSSILKFKQENIVIGCGSDEIIHLIVLAFLNKGEEVITGYPSFVIYETNTHLMDGKLHLVPLSNFTFDLEKIKSKITKKTKLIFIANPNNPTGTIVKKKEVDKFLKDIPEKIIIVFDEAYYEYVTNRNFPNILSYVKENRNIIVLRTFSKIYGLAGLRIGYGIGPENLIYYLNRVREPFNVNFVAQIAASAALDDKLHIRESRKINNMGKKFLYKELNKLKLFFVPTEANFIFIDTNIDSRILFERLLKQGIIIRTGDIFGYPTFIRVTIGTPQQNERFIKALKEVIK